MLKNGRKKKQTKKSYFEIGFSMWKMPQNPISTSISEALHVCFGRILFTSFTFVQKAIT